MATYPAKVIRPVVGNIYEAIDGSLYGYSGMINFDISASASYTMMRFNLTRDARFKMQFNCDWNVLETSATDVGVLVNVDEIDVIRVAWENQSSYVYSSGSAWETEFYVPENAEVIISVLNPSTGADLLKANVVLSGKYLDKAENSASAGVQVGDNAPPPMLADLKRWNKWEEIF